ncbi:MAG: adenylyltransferase/cytidyltransferase family protein [Acidobacteriota bacterium]
MSRAERLDWTREALAAELRRRQRSGERVVFTNGCFDLLHPGHVALLRGARERGDCLVVGVNDDDSIRRAKGPGRPIVPLAERLEVLAAIRWVDYVIPFPETTPAELLRALRPDVRVKGADWSRERLEQAGELVEGIELVLLDLVPGQSTTDLVGRALAVPLTRDEGDEPD